MSDEYPKVIQTGGITLTVADAADEARWREAPPPGPASVPVVEPEPEPAPVAEALDDRDVADPLDDIAVEMDNPVYNEPVKLKKKKTAAKKK